MTSDDKQEGPENTSKLVDNKGEQLKEIAFEDASLSTTAEISFQWQISSSQMHLDLSVKKIYLVLLKSKGRLYYSFW